jgi:hypothetical protein
VAGGARQHRLGGARRHVIAGGTVGDRTSEGIRIVDEVGSSDLGSVVPRLELLIADTRTRPQLETRQGLVVNLRNS